MMEKFNLRGLLAKPYKLLTQPTTAWESIRQEQIEGVVLFRNFLIPLTSIFVTFSFLLCLLHTSVFYALGRSIILFVASIIGTYITYRVSKEYLNDKVTEANRISLYLAVYSSAVFIPLHCLSCGFSEGFFSQLMAICSLLCLRTLYIGLTRLTHLNPQYRKSAVIIIGLLVIVAPIIVQQLLKIIFRIPTIYA